MTTVCVKVWVHGVVQGVGFRYSTQQQAKALNLSGYAINLEDGSVEVLACGEESDVNSLVSWLKAGGPRSATVEKVLQEPHQPRNLPSDFTTG